MMADCCTPANMLGRGYNYFSPITRRTFYPTNLLFPLSHFSMENAELSFKTSGRLQPAPQKGFSYFLFWCINKTVVTEELQ